MLTNERFVQYAYTYIELGHKTANGYIFKANRRTYNYRNISSSPENIVSSSSSSSSRVRYTTSIRRGDPPLTGSAGGCHGGISSTMVCSTIPSAHRRYLEHQIFFGYSLWRLFNRLDDGGRLMAKSFSSGRLNSQSKRSSYGFCCSPCWCCWGRCSCRCSWCDCISCRGCCFSCEWCGVGPFVSPRL